MKKIVQALLSVMFLMTSIHASAQHYVNSAGIRLGYTSAITYKRFFNKIQALEFMASGRNEGFQVTTLYQFHKPMPVSFNDNFFVYYGVGAHIGYEERRDLFLRQPFAPPQTPEFDTVEKAYFTMGIDPIIGIEYRWLSVPITISLDVKPYFEFVGMRYGETHFWDTAIAVKYVF